MTPNPSAIVPWSQTDQVIIPAGVSTAAELVQYGHATLSTRDMASIVAGFHAGGYEMVSTFVWTKAAATLKQQVSKLGMEFVGEMLGRPDLNDDSDPATAIADHEAVRLAESLGMITAVQALRLKHAMQLVVHFASKALGRDPDEEMLEEEAKLLLRTCVTSILGKPSFDVAIQFAEFRSRLTGQTFRPDDSEVAVIKGSPYFFTRTTLSVLLATAKTAKGAALEHSCGNVMTFVPALWPLLRDPERWQVGQAYAEVSANGNRIASAALKRALMDVRGFDFVPESLRSNTFTEAAAKVLAAHFAFNNYYHEREPMEGLANLGTTIPMPAFAKCMEATLAVRLGNRWGQAWAAQEPATRALKTLREAQWQYYVNECLPRDTTILDKLSTETRPQTQWQEVVRDYIPATFQSRDRLVEELLIASRDYANPLASTRIEAAAQKLRNRVGA